MKQVFKIASVLGQTEKKLTLQVLALGMLLGANAIQTRRKSQEGYGYD
jgi:hypothetical protein